MAQRGRLIINVLVDCPQCDETIDLMDESDTSGTNHDDDCFITRQAFPSNQHWMDAHQNFKCTDVKCSECGHTFDVEVLEY